MDLKVWSVCDIPVNEPSYKVSIPLWIELKQFFATNTVSDVFYLLNKLYFLFLPHLVDSRPLILIWQRTWSRIEDGLLFRAKILKMSFYVQRERDLAWPLVIF